MKTTIREPLAELFASPLADTGPRFVHFNLDHQNFPVPACNSGSLRDEFTFEPNKVTCPECRSHYA